MAIKEKEVSVSVSRSKHVEYFEALGYEIPRNVDKKGKPFIARGTKITVKIEQLPLDCYAVVTKICDICNVEINNQMYKMLIECRANNGTGKDQCGSCSQLNHINNRIQTSGSLKDVNPLLCEEWHPTKNDSTPDNYLPKSIKEVWWKCSKCGYEFKCSIGNRSSGGGCINCRGTKGENEIKKTLETLNIKHKTQYAYDDLIGSGGNKLRFDFAVFVDNALKFIIEYDGIFHFEKVYEEDNYETGVVHDNLKDEYCKENRLSLVRIPFWDLVNIPKIVKNFCGYYNLNNESFDTSIIEKYLVNNKNYKSHRYYYERYIRNAT